MEEPAFEPTPEPTGQLEDDPSPDLESPAELTADIDLDIDAAARPAMPPVPETHPARRGVLPPPKSDGKRVQPLAPRGQRTRGAPKRPSASGLPSGMRAPGIPEQTDAEDTDILIASAVAALTEGDPANNSSVLLTPDPIAAAATSVSTLPAPSLAPEPQAQPQDRKRRGMLWFAVAAVAVLGVLFIAFSGGDSDEPKEASATAVVAGADKQVGDAADVADVAVAAVVASPDLPPPAIETPVDLGGAWVEPEDATDVGGELAAALDVGSSELVDEAPLADDPAQGVEDVSVAAQPKPKSNRGGKRKRKSKQPVESNPRPSPAAPAKPPEDAAALLASARKALAAGQARKAYSLASKSRSAKRTSAALIVMAKAACRFGGESQAKSAFNQLSVSNRRGLRAECRNHGVRLGI